MSTYHPHTLFTMGGVLNNNAADKEIWQCGIRLLAESGGPLADHDAYLSSLVAPLTAWWKIGTSAITGAFPSYCSLNWIKANAIGANGKYSDPVTHVKDLSTPATGTTTAPFFPDIIALAISWGTAVAPRKHTYASHGRIYLPAYGQSNTSGEMRLPAGLNALWAARGTALLHVLGSGTIPAMPIVASGHNGEYNPITAVRVGDVLDVQRRRKDALKENYSVLPYIG